jgi:hypothetical protein
MTQKVNFFSRFYHNDEWFRKHSVKRIFDYNHVYKLDKFTGDHPIYMNEIIKNKNWDFKYDPSKSNMSMKDKVLNKIEQIINYRFLEYRNYKLKKI